MSRRSPLPEKLERILARVLAASGLKGASRDEVENELRTHFEDGLWCGSPADELVRRFGDPEQAGRRIGRTRRSDRGRDRIRRGGRWMGIDELWAEVGQAIRRLARAPAFTGVVILTLALGLGANTAIFSVLDAVLIKPLPYHQPDRLVRVFDTRDDRRSDTGDLYMRAPTVAAYRTWDQVFESFGGLYTYRELGADLTDGDSPIRVTVVPVTAGYFEALGVRPQVGRGFLEAEIFPGEGEGAIRGSGASVVVLGHRLWEDLFRGDPGALGRTIRLDGVEYEVVGVMPPDFQSPFGPAADAWLPMNLSRQLSNWGNYYISGIARLADGLTLDAAQERATRLYEQLADANPDAGESGPYLVPLRSDLVGSTRRTMLLILAGAAGLVLLTACLNVANLVLARGLGRYRDMALRSALGSSRGRLVISMLAENALLAVAGGALGLALGWIGVRTLLRLAPDALPGSTVPELGLTVFLFAAAATAVALVFFGLAPALRLARTEPAEVLRSGDRSATAGRLARRIRDSLVVVQVAAAVVLVAGALLLTRSFGALVDLPMSVEPEGVLTYEVNLPQARYPDGAARHAFHERLQARVTELPGVEAVGAVSWLPLNGRYHIWGFNWDPENPDGSNDEAWFGTDVRIFAGDYFGATDLGMVRGTPPADVDLGSEPMAWISAEAARVFGEIDPVGQQIVVAGASRRVVGVVEDVPVDARGTATRHTYVPHAQYADNRNWALIQLVEARGDLGVLRERIRQAILDLDPDLVLHRPRRLTDVVESARAQERFATVLMGAFAVLALTLSVVGTYGVLAGTVASRRKEIGIRMALGADRGRVRGMVLRYAAALTIPGVALGLVGALTGARLLETLLFGVDRADPATYALSVAVFAAVGLASGWVPAIRATRVDTVQVLTSE